MPQSQEVPAIHFQTFTDTHPECNGKINLSILKHSPVLIKYLIRSNIGLLGTDYAKL